MPRMPIARRTRHGEKPPMVDVWNLCLEPLSGTPLSGTQCPIALTHPRFQTTAVWNPKTEVPDGFQTQQYQALNPPVRYLSSFKTKKERREWGGYTDTPIGFWENCDEVSDKWF